METARMPQVVWRWVGTGMLAGVLCFAAVNALSYFARSGSTSLTGGNHGGGRIGFPWLVWEGNGAAMGTFHRQGLALNIISGIAASFVVGFAFGLATCKKSHGEAPPRQLAPLTPAGKQPFALQFTLRGLLVAIAESAVLLALGQCADERLKLQLLIATYWIGPGAVAATYFVAARLAPNARDQATIHMVIVIVCTSLVLGAGSGIGDMTQVLLGLFVYWTPQCVLLLGLLLVGEALRSTISNPGESRR